MRKTDIADKRNVFLQKLCEVRKLVHNELELPSSCYEGKSPGQLMLIIKELEMMEEALSTDVFVPYYPRFINDSWDFNDDLGIALMKLATLYEKL